MQTQAQSSGSITDRLIGVVTFKTPVYREIADDTTATGSAALIVVVVAVVAGVISGLIDSSAYGGILGNLIYKVLSALIVWALGSWLLAFVAKTFFQGKTDTSEMMRVTGYTYVFQILSAIPVLGFIGWILQVVANVIAIREAAEFDTTKAILSAIIAYVIVFIVVGLILGAIFAAIFVGAAVMSQ
ncbi:MAG: YIP1 family protein [Chloroflexi bacterium]|nr:YIP1 family protein [Chloroflexota bacterium]